jgi:RNA polymerase sigma-70 factor (ECF subfamily)
MAADEHVQPLIISQTIAGDRMSQAEFELFYLRTAPKLHGYLCRLSQDFATAEEVLQDAYVRMINTPARLTDELGRKAYLYKTATNILRDRWRRLKRERGWWEMNHFSEAAHYNLNLPIDMASVLDNLTAQERAVLWLAHVEELTHREIGAVLGVKERSVRVIVFRAREKAKRLLERAGVGVAHE